MSVILVGKDVAGFLAMRDEARPDVMSGLASLKARGIRLVMLTGDNRRTAEAVAAGLGIEARAELLPQDKLRIVKELQAEGFVVAKRSATASMTPLRWPKATLGSPWTAARMSRWKRRTPPCFTGAPMTSPT